MYQLLQLEWMKFRKYRVFQAMVACFVILLPGSILTLTNINQIPTQLGSKEMFFIFPTVWKYLTYTGGWLAFFFLGFLGVIAITMEFTNKTLRQNVITGLSRAEVFFAKFLFLVSISFMATLYLFICGLVIGYLHTETIYISKVFQEYRLILQFFLLCISYMTFGWLIGTFIRRTGLALFVYLTYAMFLEPVFRWAFHLTYFPGKSMHLYPLNAIEDLAPIPFGKFAGEFLTENDFDLFLSPSVAVIASSIYLFLFLGLIWWRLQKADL